MQEKCRCKSTVRIVCICLAASMFLAFYIGCCNFFRNQVCLVGPCLICLFCVFFLHFSVLLLSELHFSIIIALFFALILFAPYCTRIFQSHLFCIISPFVSRCKPPTGSAIRQHKVVCPNIRHQKMGINPPFPDTPIISTYTNNI